MSGIHMKENVSWKQKIVLIDHLNHANLFLKYSRDVDSTFNNIDEYNLKTKSENIDLICWNS